VKVVLLGGTRGIGRAIARALAERGAELFVLGRDPAALARSRSDLELRGAAKVGSAPCDLLEPAGFDAALAEAEATLGGLDTVILTAGIQADQATLESDPGLLEKVLLADFVHSIAFCEAARRRLLARGGGTLCVLSAVAGDRARASIGLYGAAKAGLTHYLEGLDHGYRRAGLRTVCVKPGFVRTGLTDGLPEPPFAADPEVVAQHVLRAIERGRPVAYVPPIWRVVMAVVRALPRALMRRLRF
jgi:NAD(P)-dependent dehydrogenase (short-subunit alcohol dehydrogenase family)